jgi:hypothetical protein
MAALGRHFLLKSARRKSKAIRAGPDPRFFVLSQISALPERTNSNEFPTFAPSEKHVHCWAREKW